MNLDVHICWDRSSPDDWRVREKHIPDLDCYNKDQLHHHELSTYRSPAPSSPSGGRFAASTSTTFP